MTPADVYKYCDPRGTDILLKLRLKITPPNRFNDPFEFAPRIKPTVARKEARRLIKDRQSERELFEGMTAQGQFAGSFKKFKKLSRLNREKMVQAVMTGYPHVAADLRKDNPDMVSREFGLLCLSAVRDNILMWSHYGQGHTGLVIGLDGGHKLLNSNEPRLVEVEYLEERVEMEYFAAPHSRKLHDQVKSLIRRKSPLWSYEREWRQLRFLNQCETDRDDSSSGQVNHFLPIEPELIRQVIIKYRASETLIREISEIKTLSHFAHVQFLRSRMHWADFTVEFGPF